MRVFSINTDDLLIAFSVPVSLDAQVVAECKRARAAETHLEVSLGDALGRLGGSVSNLEKSA